MKKIEVPNSSERILRISHQNTVDKNQEDDKIRIQKFKVERLEKLIGGVINLYIPQGVLTTRQDKLFKFNHIELQKAQQELLELDQSSSNDEKEIFTLKRKITHLERAIEWGNLEINRFLENYCRKDLTLYSDLFQTAFYLIFVGKLKEALYILSEDKEKRLWDAKSSRMQAKMFSEELILEARALSLDYRLYDAESVFKYCIFRFPSFDNYFAVGKFYFYQNAFRLAQKNLIKAQNFARTDEEAGAVMSIQGSLFWAIDDHDLSLKTFRHSVNHFKNLLLQNKRDFIVDYAQGLNNLGTLYMKRNELNQSVRFFQESLQLYRELVIDEPQTYMPELALLLDNLGTAYCGIKAYDSSLITYTESIQLFRKLVKNSPELYLFGLGSVLNNLGTLYSNIFDFDKSREAYLESLKIRQFLADKNPVGYKEVVVTLINIALLYEQCDYVMMVSPYAFIALKESNKISNPHMIQSWIEFAIELLKRYKVSF